MTAGVDYPQISVIFNSPKVFEDTGVIGRVEIFGSRQYSIVIRPGVVMVDGAASFNPDEMRVFALALNTAANVAEDYHGRSHKSQSNNHEDIT